MFGSQFGGSLVGYWDAGCARDVFMDIHMVTLRLSEMVAGDRYTDL